MMTMVIDGIGDVCALDSGDWQAVVDTFGGKVLALFHKGENILYYDREDIGHSGIPVCLPSFGPLKENVFFCNGQSWPMKQHGFIRDRVLIAEEVAKTELVLSLTADDETRKRYPFDFLFAAKYIVSENGLAITLTWKNLDAQVIPLAPGVHPYFAVADPAGISIATPARRGNNNLVGYQEQDVARSGVFTIERDMLRVCGAPDFHLIGHTVDETLISRAGQKSIVMTADPDVFNRLTVWRKTAAAPYICVEPAYVRNGLNEAPIRVGKRSAFSTTISFTIVK